MPSIEDAGRIAKEVREEVHDRLKCPKESPKAVLARKALGLLETILHTPSDKGETSVRFSDGQILKITITKEFIDNE